MKLFLKLSPVVLIILLILAFFLNPNKDQHVDAIFDAKIDLESGGKVKSKIAKGFKKLLTSKPVRKTKSAMLNYNDKTLYSTTTTKLGNKKVTYGFLGLVFLF